jgi:hypothetical protein
MGIVQSRVCFDGEVPAVSEIETAVRELTGLHLTLDASRAPFIRVGCGEFATDVEMHVDGRVVVIEQGIARPGYLLHAVREALVSLGGQRCSLRNEPLPDANAPPNVERWRERSFTARFADRHPVLAGFVALGIMVPRDLWRLVARR